MPNPFAPVVPSACVLRARATSARETQAKSEPIDVSVCIANWNCREMLHGCLQSLHDQPQGVHIETIVADNGSTDGAADMVEREFPEVILHRNATNVGFARPNNQTAQHSSGRALVFLDNDTLVPPG